MPKQSIDYSNTYFYKIVYNDLTISDCYVGHTTDFRRRKAHHKHSCNNINDKNYNFPLYQFIRSHGGWDNWVMVLIEQCSCESSLHACKREHELMVNLNATLNKQVPGRTMTQYYQDHKYEFKDNRKPYYEAHREHKIEMQKQYFEDNKLLINEYRKTACVCECGSSYQRSNKTNHLKSLKHQAYEKQQSESQI